MTVSRFYLIVLIVVILLLGYLNYQIWKPFLIAIAWAMVLSTLFYPLYAFVLKYLKQRTLASLLTLTIILAVIIGPFSYLSLLLVKEVGALADRMEAGKFDALRSMIQQPSVQAVIQKVTSWFNITPEELDRMIGENLLQLGKELIARITRGVREIITVAFHFVVMAISIFFFLKDGPRIFAKVYDYLPFSVQQKDRLVKQVKDIIISTLYGGVIVAMVQGTLGGFAFSIVGITSPILWGSVMAVASFLPVVGPFIIWAPAAVYLLVEGFLLKGISLVVMGVFGISLIDNLLRPMIIGNRTKMPFLVIFFSVLGGIRLFGLLGFVMGPMVLAVFVSVIEIFRNMEEVAMREGTPKERA
jgi:predicted PurR-regulated permease PerM